MQADPPELTLASEYALQTCAALITQRSGPLVVVTHNPQMGQALIEMVQLSANHRCLIVSGKEIDTSAVEEIKVMESINLAFLDPFIVEKAFLEVLLQLTNLRLVIVLRVGELGRKILPEWKHFPQQNVPLRIFRQALSPDSGWAYKRITIGSPASMFWGFLGGHLLHFKRPDLADRCNARMRRDLFPASRYRLPYLTITQVSRKAIPSR